MHIWLINQTPRPYKLPTLRHPRPHAHADTLPDAGKRRQLLSEFAVYWERKEVRGTWEGFKCATLITHKWAGPVPLMWHHIADLMSQEILL